MKRLIFLLGVLAAALMPAELFGQTETVKITGTVKNARGEALAGVNILVKSAGETFGGTSGRKGEYTVSFTAADTVTASFSHVGYHTYTFSMQGNGDVRRDVVLTDKGVVLDEVEVTADYMHMGDDRVTYIPTRRQVNGANTGVMLLFNMMIPQIMVDPMGGSVSAVDKTQLGIFIDERKADAGELARLRPKDIAKVEYYDTPTGVFAQSGVDRAVNIVTKKYTSGGYVDARTTTHVIYPQGNYSVQGSFDKGDVNILAMAGSNFGRTDYTGTTSREEYMLAPSFTKSSYVDHRETKSLSDYGLLRATVRGKRSYFLAQAMLSWNESPDNTAVNSLSYTGNVYPSAKSVSESYSNGLTPALSLFHQVRFNDKNIFLWHASYSYSRNKYRSRYEEGGFAPIINNAHDKYHKAQAGLNYMHTFGNGGQLGMEVGNFLNKSRSVYRGTSPSEQDMLTNEFLFIPSYTHRFGKKFSLFMRFGVDISTYKVNGMKSRTRLFTRPALSGDYNIDGTSNLSFTAYMGSFVPSLSMMNEAELRVSEYEVKRGNPDLKSGKPITASLSYSKYWNKFSLSAYAKYDGVIDNNISFYTVEDNMMVQTYACDGNYNKYTLGVSGVLRLLSNSLQLRLMPEFFHTNLTGTYKERLNQLGFYAQLHYSTGAYSFSGYYNAPQTILSSTPWYYKSKCNYGLSASWNHRGLFIQVGCQNIFNGKRGHAENYFDYGVYDTFEKTVSRNLGANVYVSLSYSFDFGRQVQRQDVNVDTSSKSGILK